MTIEEVMRQAHEVEVREGVTDTPNMITLADGQHLFPSGTDTSAVREPTSEELGRRMFGR